MAIAVTHTLCCRLMDHFGRAHGSSLQEHIHLLDRMITFYVQHHGHSEQALFDARWAVVRAGRAANDTITDQGRQAQWLVIA